MFWLSPHVDDDATSSRDDESTLRAHGAPQDVELCSLHGGEHL
jgi:hypothetical protein